MEHRRNPDSGWGGRVPYGLYVFRARYEVLRDPPPPPSPPNPDAVWACGFVVIEHDRRCDVDHGCCRMVFVDSSRGGEACARALRRHGFLEHDFNDSVPFHERVLRLMPGLDEARVFIYGKPLGAEKWDMYQQLEDMAIDKHHGAHLANLTGPHPVPSKRELDKIIKQSRQPIDENDNTDWRVLGP